MNYRLLVAGLLIFGICAGEASARKWTDLTGNFSLEAELVSIKDGKVSLKKADGKIVVVAVEKLSKADQEHVKSLNSEDASATPKGETRELAKDDGKPAGKKSFPRGHAVGFEAPEGTWYLTSVRIHGARYGQSTPPKEDFHITLCDKDFKPIVDFPFPYRRFRRGTSKWVTLKTKPTEVPSEFVICANFNAEQTKGVYVSHDAEGQALVGLPNKMAGTFSGGDWLMRVELDQQEKDAAKSDATTRRDEP